MILTREEYEAKRAARYERLLAAALRVELADVYQRIADMLARKANQKPLTDAEVNQWIDSLPATVYTVTAYSRTEVLAQRELDAEQYRPESI